MRVNQQVTDIIASQLTRVDDAQYQPDLQPDKEIAISFGFCNLL